MKRLVFAAWRLLAGLSRPSKAANARRLRARGETLASFTIREATAADIPALAQLHVTTWNATYAPLLVNGPGVAIREHQWREAFAKNDGSWFCFVVERPDGELVGFAKGTKSDGSEFGGELNRSICFRITSASRAGPSASWATSPGASLAKGSRRCGCSAMRAIPSQAWLAWARRRPIRIGTGNYDWRTSRTRRLASLGRTRGLPPSRSRFHFARATARQVALVGLVAFRHWTRRVAPRGQTRA